MTPRTSTLIASALVLLAGGTGLLWPKSNIAAEDTIKPIPVPTLSYRSPMQAIEEPPAYPAWTVRADGLWVPWTMQPPAWLATITSTYVVAETIPLPPERPVNSPPPTNLNSSVSSSQPPQKRIVGDNGLCARHGLRQVWTDKYRWRCQR